MSEQRREGLAETDALEVAAALRALVREKHYLHLTDRERATLSSAAYALRTTATETAQLRERLEAQRQQIDGLREGIDAALGKMQIGYEDDAFAILHRLKKGLDWRAGRTLAADTGEETPE